MWGINKERDQDFAQGYRNATCLMTKGVVVYPFIDSMDGGFTDYTGWDILIYLPKHPKCDKIIDLLVIA